MSTIQHPLPDLKKWNEAIRTPAWYLDIVPDFRQIELLKDSDPEAYRTAKDKAYAFFERHLISETVCLGKSGKDWDADRRHIDTVVIHHTGSKPGMTTTRLSAIELIRLYAAYYAEPYGPGDEGIVGQPIWSNHLRNGMQVFYPYHWIIRPDGNAENLLYDHEIGWHAGHRDTNCRSVAIVLDGNYENARPSRKMLEGIAGLMKVAYQDVPTERVIGHREVKENTACPSNLFLADGDKPGWKQELHELIRRF